MRNKNHQSKLFPVNNEENPQNSDNSKYTNFLAKLQDYRKTKELYRESYVTIDQIRKIIDEMVLWCDQPDVLTIEEFVHAKCIPWATLEYWLKKYPELAEAYQHVKIGLAAKREKGMLRREYPHVPVMYAQRNYTPIWQDLAKSHAADKDLISQVSLEEKNALREIVEEVLAPTPHTKEVPDKEGK